ncbi:GP130 [Caviid betaherpesvirus 2]|uniref:PGP130 n=2 Tax=Caviid betaherpesvirus 2 TaxID=33706 RepID=C6L6E8_9BETA|nr:GP130 [Caviid betaherpesvirus 2]AGE11586.1 GP130 [Caviid betaherpesvirus 2]BAH86635.1 pGP130 [Caviid betaherpesvirus 2]BAJ78574.1 GP130 [Caviid betaherpesvirus 2]
MHLTCLLMPTSTLRYKINNVRYVVSSVIEASDPVRLLTVRTCIPALVHGVLAAIRSGLTIRIGFLPRRIRKTNRYIVWRPFIGERHANVILVRGIPPHRTSHYIRTSEYSHIVLISTYRLTWWSVARDDL